MTEKYAQNTLSNTYPGGNTLRLSWGFPTDFNPSTDTLVILRKERAFSEDENDGEVIFATADTTVTQFFDTNLKDNTYYYYTWMINDGATFWFSLGQQDYALSCKRWGFSNIIYAEMTEQTRLLDSDLSSKNLSDIWGQMLDIIRSEVYAFGYMRSGTQSNPETMPAMVSSLGLDKLRGMPLIVLRRAVIHAVYIFKRKGTTPGIIAAVRMLTGWIAFLTEARNLIFKTWDGQSRADFGETYAVAPGVVVDPTKSYLADEWAASLFIDNDRARYSVISNQPSSFLLQTSNTPDFFNVSSTTTATGFGQIQDSTQTWTTDQYRGGEVTDSAGNTHRIAHNTSTQLVFSDPYDKPAAGAYTLRPYWEVRQGDHLLTYDDFDGPCLRGHQNDPFSQLYNPSDSITVLELTDLNVIITIQNVAKTAGYVKTITPTVLTDTSANWTVNQFVGMNLNPNSLQEQEFAIVSNTATTITVAVAPVGMDALSSVNSNYFVITARDSVRLKRLRDLLPDFMAFFARPVIFFEPTECP